MSGPIGPGGSLLGKEAVQQIKEVVQAFRGGGGADPTRKNPMRQAWQPGTRDAVVVNAITQANGSGYGSGSATIMIISVSNNGVGTAASDPSFNGPQPVYNWSQTSGSNNGNTVVANTHIQVNWCNGFWELGWNDGCPS